MKREMLVGIVFMVAVGLALFGTIAVSGLELFAPKSTWYVELDDLGGLQAGDEVWVLGSRMGVVSRVRFDQENHKFRLSLKMDPKAPIYENYRITIGERSALGGKYLRVQPGDPGRAADIEHLVGDPGTGDVMSQMSGLINKLDKPATAISEGTGTLGKVILRDDLYDDAKEFLADLKETSASLKVVTRRIEDKEGTVGKLIGDDDVHALVKDHLENLKTGDSAIAKLMRDESGKMVDDLRETSANLKSISEKLDRGSGTFAMLLNKHDIYDNTTTAVSTATDTMHDVRGVVQDVRSGKGIAGMLIADEQARTNVTDTFDNMRQVTQNARDGKGSLGKLLTDEELYDNFSAAAKNVNTATEKIHKGDGTVAKLLNDAEIYDRVKKLLTRAIDAVENARDSAPVTAIMGLLTPFQ